jgi:hypothetical protein
MSIPAGSRVPVPGGNRIPPGPGTPLGTTRVTRYREAAQALDLELTAGQLTALDAA